MKLLMSDGKGAVEVGEGGMSYAMTRQAIAIADCIGRLIPQEGVDYDVVVTFKGVNDPGVSMRIEPLTDKGEFWRDYVTKMIGKYPPRMEDPEGAKLGEGGVDVETVMP